ncbi:hypothetical protein H257_09498 [Aphanomyces astaci]|uniref:GST N-terminal domain-containing protein n=2 Tax=Aphanomyces astaci TaxID=112090 RepID=W4G9W0_APHAT|nr:hypothetical protein H257_09498 [Aphanomyces astaci]ETV76482.1 hypothetical protein H257_09498 [Aphanomyces astaci]RQM21174.1 hypothetical protein B5M09_005065 [Aphanomyces astaci]|eukprot:XP_009834027.1 hypothetical protein H257_09498 [Aphanomyces astaci]
MAYTLVVGNKNYSTWPLRAWVLLKELNVPFEEYVAPLNDLSPGKNLRDPWINITPTRKFPLLIVSSNGATALTGDRLIVWDSLAIAETVYESYPAVWPADSRARAFARSATAEMHSGFSALRDTCNNNVGLRIKLHSTDNAFAADLARLSALIKQGLTSFAGPFLAGPTFTAADAMYCPVAFRFQTYGISVADADVNAYFDRLRNLTSMQEWEQGALAEPYRIQKYEDEARQVGVVVSDLRKA